MLEADEPKAAVIEDTMQKQIFVAVISGVLTLAAFEFVAKPYLEKKLNQTSAGA